MEKWDYMGKYFPWLEQKRKFLSEDERFISIRKALKTCTIKNFLNSPFVL